MVNEVNRIITIYLQTTNSKTLIAQSKSIQVRRTTQVAMYDGGSYDEAI